MNLRAARRNPSPITVLAVIVAACARVLHGHAESEIPAVFAAALDKHRDSFEVGPVVISPFRLTAQRLAPRWSAQDLALVLRAPGVRLAAIDDSACSRPEPLTCVLKPGEFGVVFGEPTFVGDSARVDLEVFAKHGAGSRFNASLTRVALVRRQARWVVVGQRWLGGT